MVANAGSFVQKYVSVILWFKKKVNKQYYEHYCTVCDDKNTISFIKAKF